KDSYEQALTLLRENRDVMDKLAEFLIEKETITGKEFMKIFREIKGIPEPEQETTDENKTTVDNEDASEETKEEKANEVEMPTESFEELFQMAKDAVEAEDETVEKKEIITEEKTEEIEETKSVVRGNYSNVSIEDLLNDKK
ncbi:MAG: hypothetical protein IJ274_17240, partial [Lachnospiraceae bacterium]|nr:hypothetical protein [Lachnospiraceae bacterium]